MADTRICSVAGCGKRQLARGLCSAHNWRFLKYGDPLAMGVEYPRGAALDYVNHVALKHTSDSCLLWPFPRGKKGYGFLFYEGRSKEVHRVVCRLAHGEPPTPLHETAHSCGNGHLGCINPRHLRWSTHSDNIADKTRHGTETVGEKHGMAKLTADDVAEVRALAGTMTQKAIARRFGVSQSAIALVVSRRNWKHV